MRIYSALAFVAVDPHVGLPFVGEEGVAVVSGDHVLGEGSGVEHWKLLELEIPFAS